VPPWSVPLCASRGVQATPPPVAPLCELWYASGTSAVRVNKPRTVDHLWRGQRCAIHFPTLRPVRVRSVERITEITESGSSRRFAQVKRNVIHPCAAATWSRRRSISNELGASWNTRPSSSTSRRASTNAASTLTPGSHGGFHCRIGRSRPEASMTSRKRRSSRLSAMSPPMRRSNSRRDRSVPARPRPHTQANQSTNRSSRWRLPPR